LTALITARALPDKFTGETMASGTDGSDFFTTLSSLARTQIKGLSAMWGMALDQLTTNHAKAAAAWTVNPEGGVTRTADGVVVTSKELVMQVFLNTDENYSVKGYNERASNSIGPIYLGLDWGPEYEAQSTKANAAIMAVTRREAFDVALKETRAALKALPDPAAFDIQNISDTVLAAVCKYWFDVPDGEFVQAGGFSLSNVLPPARCPADYTYPSAYIFHPDPDVVLTMLGERTGQMLREAVGHMLASLRTAGKQPQGTLSRAFFEAFPNPADTDLLARVIIGAMMGMLPTVNGNLNSTVKAWQRSSTFMALQGKLKKSTQTDEFARAQEVIQPALEQEMQMAPTPDAVWRTAVKAHTLGTKNPVQVNPGDKIYISIIQAMQENLRGVLLTSVRFLAAIAMPRRIRFMPVPELRRRWAFCSELPTASWTNDPA
jgi:hypothetical protein